MIYKKVPLITDKISAIAIGCWNFGGDWDCSDDSNTREIVHAAVDHGINFFDVAPVYGWYHSEEVLGHVLEEGGLRNSVLIASKAGLLWNEKHQTRNNLTRKSLMEEIDGSLKRLRTDHIDIYQMHWPDHNTPIEETAEALVDIKKAGKIRYVGLSNFSQADVEKMQAIIPVECQQGLYNMLERNTASYHGIPLEYKTEDEMLITIKKYGQAFLPYSPYMQGLLTGRFSRGKSFSSKDIRNQNPKFTNPSVYAKYYDCYETLAAFANKIGHPMNEICVNWLRQKEEVTAIIGGVSSIRQLEENIHALTWELTPEELGEINGIIEPFREL